MTRRTPFHARRLIALATAGTLALAASAVGATTPSDDAWRDQPAHRDHRGHGAKHDHSRAATGRDVTGGATVSLAPILDLSPTVPGASFQLSLGGIDLSNLLAGGLSMRLFVAQPSWVSFGLGPVTAASSSTATTTASSSSSDAAPAFNGWWNGLGGGTDTALAQGARDGGDSSRSMSRFATLQVAVTPVPEPADWLAMGAGLGMLAMWGRRRTRRV